MATEKTGAQRGGIKGEGQGLKVFALHPVFFYPVQRKPLSRPASLSFQKTLRKRLIKTFTGINQFLLFPWCRRRSAPDAGFAWMPVPCRPLN
jgi:hypothetical protein